MNEKFIHKFMRFAKFIAEDKGNCLSRTIGSVIVEPQRNRVVSIGWNGPPRKLPDPDSFVFLHDYVYPQLTNKDKIDIQNSFANKFLVEAELKTRQYRVGETIESSKHVHDSQLFANAFAGCKICPRKLVGAKSGERLELCQCVHSEHNAILNATESLDGYSMMAWCGVPCVECADAIIQSGIKNVYCLKKDDEEKDAYQFWRSRWRFKKAGVFLHELIEDWIFQE